MSTETETAKETKPKKETVVKKPLQKNTPTLPWMRAPVDVSLIPERPLSLLPSLHPSLNEALTNMGFTSLFPVQVAMWQETIGPGGFERDLCVNSPTGSGKTLAYALPIVQALASCSVKCLRALVVLPTRDLALQVKEVFEAITPAVGLSVGLAVGQSSLADEISTLIKRPNLEGGFSYDSEDRMRPLQSAVDILVATPGRLMDHITTTKGFTLEHLRYLVVDETDRLLREAYQSWLPSVLKLAQSSDEMIASHDKALFTPSFCGSFKTFRRVGVERGFKGKAHPRLVKMVLSATLTQDPSKLNQLDLHHPLFLTTGQTRYQIPKELESYKVICDNHDKPVYLVALLQQFRGEKCIVFTSSVESTHKLCSLLNFFGDMQIKIKEYHRSQHQAVRSKILKAFRKGKVDVLVSSDAMARGMDVEGVKTVINYDVPPYAKTYIHRVGRTGRAGQAGRCFTLLRKDEVNRFKKLLRKAGDESCAVYTLPSDSVELLNSVYSPALEKLKENIESQASRKRKVSFKASELGRRKRLKQSKQESR